MTAAPDEAVERAEEYGRELDRPTAETLALTDAVLFEHWWQDYVKECRCGHRPGEVSHTAHVAQQLAAAGLLAALADDRPAGAPAPRPARRVGSFAAPGGPRRLADEEDE